MLSPSAFNSSPPIQSPGASVDALRPSSATTASPIHAQTTYDYPASFQTPYGGTTNHGQDAPTPPPDRPPPPSLPPAVALSATLDRLEFASRQIAAIRSGAEALIDALDRASRIDKTAVSSAPPALPSAPLFHASPERASSLRRTPSGAAPSFSQGASASFRPSSASLATPTLGTAADVAHVAGLQPGKIVLSVAEAVRKAITELRSTGRDLISSRLVDGGGSDITGWRGGADGGAEAAPPSSPSAVTPPPPCPDGSRLVYQWCRYVEGHAVATAIERAKTAAIAFAEQSGRGAGLPPREVAGGVDVEKKGSTDAAGEAGSIEGRKRPWLQMESGSDDVADVLQRLGPVCPHMKLTLSSRVAWGRQVYPPAALAYSSEHEFMDEDTERRNAGGNPHRDAAASLAAHGRGLESGLGSGMGTEIVGEGRPGIIHVECHGVFHAIISLAPCSASRADAISVFAPDEMLGVHAWGLSTRHVFRLLTAHAIRALHCFSDDDQGEKQGEGGAGEGAVRKAGTGGGLERLLMWLYGYRTLFTQPCAVCQRVLAPDPPSRALLPPLLRPFESDKQREKSKRERRPDILPVSSSSHSAGPGAAAINQSGLGWVATESSRGGSSLAAQSRMPQRRSWGGGGIGSDERLERAASGVPYPQRGSGGAGGSWQDGHGREEEGLAYHINCVLKKDDHVANKPGS